MQQFAKLHFIQTSEDKKGGNYWERVRKVVEMCSSYLSG